MCHLIKRMLLLSGILYYLDHGTWVDSNKSAKAVDGST